MRYRVIETEYGYVAILVSDKGLAGLALPAESADRALWQLGRKAEQAVEDAALLPGLVDRLQRYFAGEVVDFPDTPDLSAGTDFQQRVWQAARLIPRGETRSYGWVAAQAGSPRGFRATGQAMGKNPVPVIVPCHRVIAGDGTIGGFSSGLDRKRLLMSLESIRVR